MNLRRSLLFCCSFFIASLGLSAASLEDSTKTKSKYTLGVRANYPMPLSGATFNRIYSGLTSIEVSVQRMERQRFYWGLSFGHILFQTSSKVLDIKSYMQVYAPAATAAVRGTLKKFAFMPFIEAGYAFILFTGVDADGNAKPSFHQQGAFFKTGLCVGYALNKKIELGLNGAWVPVLQHFGNKPTFESNFISIVDYGIYFTYRL